MTAWPKDNQTARNAFYGDPGRGEIAAQMVPVVPPFAMYYEGRKIKAIQFHRKAAPALLAALNEIWDYCGHDQATVDKSGASNYNGAYNHRMVRGSATKWSNHAYAAAIDLNAGENALGVKKGTMPQFIVDAFCRQGAMWGGWYSGRPDWMHFEFVDNGGRSPKSKPPTFSKVAHLFEEQKEAPADEFEDSNFRAEDEKPAEPVDNTVNDKGINVQPQHATYDVDVEILQQKLLKLNYNEVGDADGFWGGKTRGATAAFMNDRGQPTDGTFTPAVSAELNKALSENWSRPIAPSRANATAKDIAPKVEVVNQSLWQRFSAKVVAWLAGIGLTGSTLSSTFETVKDKLEPVRNMLGKIPPEAWFISIGIIAGLIWWLSNRGINSAVKDYNTGKIN